MAATRTASGANRSRTTTVERVPEIRNGVAAAIFFGLSLIYFLPAFLPGNHLFGTDYLAGGYFFYEFVSERLAAGELPKWVPYIYGGLPLSANPGSTFYPVRLFADFLLPITWILPFIFAFQFGAGGFGMYLLAKELGCRSWVALISGLAFEFTGITVSAVYAGHDGRVIAATFAPIFFYFLHRGIRTGRVAPFAGAAATIGFSLLSFQIQSNYYLLLAGMGWAIFSLIHLGHHRNPAALTRRVAFGVAAVAFGFVVASVNFLPFLDYVPESPRGAEGGRGYDYAVSWSMPPGELISIAVPEAPGILENYQGANPFKLHTEYVGALVVVLAIVGIGYTRKNRYWWFFAGLALVTLTVAFGGHTPIYRLYYELLPGTARFRAPSISFFVVSFALVAMATLTLEKLASIHEGADRAVSSPSLLKWIGGVIVLAAVATAFAIASSDGFARDAAAVAGYGRFALFAGLVGLAFWLWWSGRVRTVAFLAIVSLVTLADLWIIDRRFFETVPSPAVTFAADDVVQFLRSQPQGDRVWVLPFPAGSAYQNGGNYLMHHEIHQAGGDHGNQLQRLNEFAGAGEEVYVDWSNFLEAPNFLRAGNIKYIVSMVELNTPMFREVYRGSALIYENLAALPRAYLVGTALSSADSSAALMTLALPEFDPAHAAIVFSDQQIQLPGTPLTGAAQVVESGPDRVVVRTTADRDALLVLADNYFAGWTATVNGQNAPIYRTNHTFRGVLVGAGDNEVVFEFRPSDLYTGFYIYLAGLALLAAYGIWLLWSRRRAVEPAAAA